MIEITNDGVKWVINGLAETMKKVGKLTPGMSVRLTINGQESRDFSMTGEPQRQEEDPFCGPRRKDEDCSAQAPMLGGRVHSLKTDPEYFQASFSGDKPWEIRLNDRGYKVGDSLVLQETRYSRKEMDDGAPMEYTGRTLAGKVVYIMEGETYGLMSDWVIMSVRWIY